MMNVTIVPGGPGQSMYVDNGLISSAAATATGWWQPKSATFSSYQLISTAAATVVIEATNENPIPQGTAGNPVLLGTITNAGAGGGGFSTQADWRYVRARITSNSGIVNVLQGT